MLAFLCVFIGGGIGSSLRYLSNLAFARWTHFPYSTLTVNLIGSLLIGIFFALAQKMQWSIEIKSLLIAGFLGGLTTFSSFSMDTLKLIMDGRSGIALLNFSINNLIGIALSAIGWWIVQKIA